MSLYTKCLVWFTDNIMIIGNNIVDLLVINFLQMKYVPYWNHKDLDMKWFYKGEHKTKTSLCTDFIVPAT